MMALSDQTTVETKTERDVGGFSPEEAVMIMMADAWILSNDNIRHEKLLYKMSHHGQIWSASYYTSCNGYDFKLAFTDIDSFIESMTNQPYIFLTINPEYKDTFNKKPYIDELVKQAEKDIIGVDHEVDRHYKAMLSSINRKNQLIKHFMKILKTASKGEPVSLSKQLMDIIKKGLSKAVKPDEVT